MSASTPPRRSATSCSRCQLRPPASKHGMCTPCLDAWIDKSRVAQGLPLQVEDDAALEKVAALMLSPAELERRAS